MTNNEMVSVPRGLLERLATLEIAGVWTGSVSPIEELRATLSAIVSDDEQVSCKSCEAVFSAATWGQCGGMCDGCGSPG